MHEKGGRGRHHPPPFAGSAFLNRQFDPSTTGRDAGGRHAGATTVRKLPCHKIRKGGPRRPPQIGLPCGLCSAVPRLRLAAAWARRHAFCANDVMPRPPLPTLRAPFFDSRANRRPDETDRIFHSLFRVKPCQQGRPSPSRRNDPIASGVAGDMSWETHMGFGNLAAMAAAITMLAVSAASAQGRPPNAPAERQCPPGLGTGTFAPNETTGSSDLSERLSASKGIICPPAGVDPGIAVPPQGGGRMPIIPPPGTPGGDPGLQPK
jgi:hypothetical protein